MERSCLIKVSGNLIGNKDVEDQILREADEYYVVCIHGVGKQFNEASDEEICFENGNRIASQEQLKKLFYGSQQRIREYLHSVFEDRVRIVSPITEKDGIFENINGDGRFRDFYESGFLKEE